MGDGKTNSEVGFLYKLKKGREGMRGQNIERKED